MPQNNSVLSFLFLPEAEPIFFSLKFKDFYFNQDNSELLHFKVQSV